jgi:tRNA threonylcarbamoyladenosine biosynthesis protein TsaB
MNDVKPTNLQVKILAVDTATEACSAALYINGELLERYQLAPREHTQLILQMVEQLLEQQQLTLKQLDALAFGRGPGSFTGVRIATGVVHGLAFASDLPVVPVSTLAAIAQYAHQQSGQSRVLAGIDARMGGIYWGAYTLGDDGLMQLQGSEQIASPDALQLPECGEWFGAGSAWGSYPSELQQRFAQAGAVSLLGNDSSLLPHAAAMAELAAAEFVQGHALAAAQAQPVYLRDDVAKKSAQQ